MFGCFYISVDLKELLLIQISVLRDFILKVCCSGNGRGICFILLSGFSKEIETKINFIVHKYIFNIHIYIYICSCSICLINSSQNIIFSENPSKFV